MFRKMRRFKQQISSEECIDILREQPRGVLAVFGEDGYPYAFPMNHFYQEGFLYFHCAKEGHKLDAIEANAKVSFCVMDEGFRKEGDWALNIKSVIIFGTIKKVDDKEKAASIARKLGNKFFPTEDDVEKEMKNAFSRMQLLELSIDEMTGKLVNES